MRRCLERPKPHLRCTRLAAPETEIEAQCLYTEVTGSWNAAEVRLLDTRDLLGTASIAAAMLTQGEASVRQRTCGLVFVQ